MDQLEKLIADLRRILPGLDEMRSENSKECAAGVCLYVFLAVSNHMAWPDSEMVKMFRTGVKLLGKQSRHVIYREKDTTATLSEEELLNIHVETRARGAFGYPRKGEQAEAMRKAMKEEQDLGFFSQAFICSEIDANFPEGWAVMPTFPLWQKLKWKMIDSGATGHNDTLSSAESIHTTSATAGLMLAPLFDII